MKPHACPPNNHSQQSLKKCFPEYDGPEGEAMPALKFIEQKYKQVCKHVLEEKEEVNLRSTHIFYSLWREGVQDVNSFGL